MGIAHRIAKLGNQFIIKNQTFLAEFNKLIKMDQIFVFIAGLSLLLLIYRAFKSYSNNLYKRNQESQVYDNFDFIQQKLDDDMSIYEIADYLSDEMEIEKANTLLVVSKIVYNKLLEEYTSTGTLNVLEARKISKSFNDPDFKNPTILQSIVDNNSFLVDDRIMALESSKHPNKVPGGGKIIVTNYFVFFLPVTFSLNELLKFQQFRDVFGAILPAASILKLGIDIAFVGKGIQTELTRDETEILLDKLNEGENFFFSVREISNIEQVRTRRIKILLANGREFLIEDTEISRYKVVDIFETITYAALLNGNLLIPKNDYIGTKVHNTGNLVSINILEEKQ